jgi:hypothetical protein
MVGMFIAKGMTENKEEKTCADQLTFLPQNLQRALII